jgi:hypothetical protein
MPLFAIWRELDHSLDEAEKEAITIRSIGALEWFPHVAWVRSFAIDEPGIRLHSLCTYHARSEAELRETSLRCAVPFVEIREVEERRGPGDERDGALVLVSGTEGAFVPPPGWELVYSYHDRERGYSRAVYHAASGPAVAGVAGVDSIEPVSLVHPADWEWVYDSLNVPKSWLLEPAATAQ